jgi:hypothetical protein
MYRSIEHSQVVTTNNCNALTGLHTLNVTVTISHKIKSSSSVFTGRFLACYTLNHTHDCLTSWLINYLSYANSLSSFFTLTLGQSQRQSYVTTDGQSASLPWNEAPVWGFRPDFYYCQTAAGLLMWSALSDERTDLSFTIAAGPRQRSHFRIRVPWHSWPYFTVSDSRLPFTSPPATRRVTVEVFEPASTRGLTYGLVWPPFITLRDPYRKHRLKGFQFAYLS